MQGQLDFFPSLTNIAPRAESTKKNPKHLSFVVTALEQTQSKGT